MRTPDPVKMTYQEQWMIKTVGERESERGERERERERIKGICTVSMP